MIRRFIIALLELLLSLNSVVASSEELTLIPREKVFVTEFGRLLADLPAYEVESAGEARKLIERGADPDYVNHCTPLLPKAANNANVELVEVLLNIGKADPNVPSCHTHSALTETLKAWDEETAGRRLRIVRMLFKAGANPNFGYESARRAIHFAAAQPSAIEALKLFLSSGVDPNEPPPKEQYSEGGATPLAWAAYRGSIDGMKTLLDAGARVEPFEPFAPDRRWPETGSSLLAAIASKSIEKVELLLHHGPDVNQIAKIDLGWMGNELDEYEGPPLHLAACLGLRQSVVSLLRLGADSETTINWLWKYTPLDLAVINNHVGVVADLIEHGAKVGDRTTSRACSRQTMQLLCTDENRQKDPGCEFLRTGEPWPVSCMEEIKAC